MSSCCVVVVNINRRRGKNEKWSTRLVIKFNQQTHVRASVKISMNLSSNAEYAFWRWSSRPGLEHISPVRFLIFFSCMHYILWALTDRHQWDRQRLGAVIKTEREERKTFCGGKLNAWNSEPEFLISLRDEFNFKKSFTHFGVWLSGFMLHVLLTSIDLVILSLFHRFLWFFSACLNFLSFPISHNFPENSSSLRMDDLSTFYTLRMCRQMNSNITFIHSRFGYLHNNFSEQKCVQKWDPKWVCKLKEEILFDVLKRRTHTVDHVMQSSCWRLQFILQCSTRSYRTDKFNY